MNRVDGNAGGTILFSGGELDGVTYDGALNLAATSSSVTISSNGIILKGAGGTGPGTVNLSGSSAGLHTQGSQTLDNATINLSGSHEYIYQTLGVGTLTLGANLTINDTGTSNFQGIQGGTTAGYGLARLIHAVDEKWLADMA